MDTKPRSPHPGDILDGIRRKAANRRDEERRGEVLEFLDALSPEDYKSLIESTKQAQTEQQEQKEQNKAEFNRIVKTLANVRHGVKFGFKKNLVLEVNGEIYPDEDGEIQLEELEVQLSSSDNPPSYLSSSDNPLLRIGTPYMPRDEVMFRELLEDSEKHLFENITSATHEYMMTSGDLPTIPEIADLCREIHDAVEILEHEAELLENCMEEQERPEDVVSSAFYLANGRTWIPQSDTLWAYILAEAFCMESESKEPVGPVVARWPMGDDPPHKPKL